MTEQSKNKVAFDDKMLMLFEGNLKRIFAMKITRSTFRELQNVILSCVEQNKELANFLFETLLTGQMKVTVPNEKHREMLEDCIKFFTIPARLAKEVYERGEFVNIITSDLMSQGEQIAFMNRLRRVDGEEFVFLSDAQNTVHIVNHFVTRLTELESKPEGKKELDKFKKELKLLGERLKQMAL
ncbi:MAG: hypothetical protein S4CHLAM123_00330 [Chlamydiales bacterium]|nr:hypothetical protein [Chlamydiales bacterium]